MRIAVIADTHNRLPAALRPILAQADEIWHLGDICNADILRELEGSVLPSMPCAAIAIRETLLRKA